MATFLPAFIIITPHVPEHHRHPRACAELNLHDELEAGCFLTGHPRIHEPVDSATLAFGEEKVYLFGPGAAPLGSVSYKSIVLVAVESHEAVKKRFSESRLMRLGTHLLAFRARETSDGSYLIVEWEAEEGEKGERHDGIFCFEGLAADSRARHLRDAVLHHAASYRRLTRARLQEPFASLLDEFETRRCEHCGKTLRSSAPLRERPAA
jgi:hypothetical protein